MKLDFRTARFDKDGRLTIEKRKLAKQEAA
jgi:hypothetical protein